jgi:hypothetical protein
MSVDAAGIAHEGDKAMSRLREVANAPIFHPHVVGGPSHSPDEMGRQVASAAMRILGET